MKRSDTKEEMGGRGRHAASERRSLPSLHASEPNKNPDDGMLIGEALKQHEIWQNISSTPRLDFSTIGTEHVADGRELGHAQLHGQTPRVSQRELAQSKSECARLQGKLRAAEEEIENLQRDLWEAGEPIAQRSIPAECQARERQLLDQVASLERERDAAFLRLEGDVAKPHRQKAPSEQETVTQLPIDCNALQQQLVGAEAALAAALQREKLLQERVLELEEERDAAEHARVEAGEKAERAIWEQRLAAERVGVLEGRVAVLQAEAESAAKVGSEQAAPDVMEERIATLQAEADRAAHLQREVEALRHELARQAEAHERKRTSSVDLDSDAFMPVTGGASSAAPAEKVGEDAELAKAIDELDEIFAEVGGSRPDADGGAGPRPEQTAAARRRSAPAGSPTLKVDKNSAVREEQDGSTTDLRRQLRAMRSSYMKCAAREKKLLSEIEQERIRREAAEQEERIAVDMLHSVESENRHLEELLHELRSTVEEQEEPQSWFGSIMDAM